MYQRFLDLSGPLRQRSVFLFGARQTGKSTLLRERFPEARLVDLLAADTFRELSATPEALRQSLTARDTLVVIDEVQRLPELLNEVHLLIERNKRLRFVLTGSSARRLRRGGANLLAGRARTLQLFPLVWPEYGEAQLGRVLTVGSLPSVLDSDEPFLDLKDYAGTYLAEEIRAEALTRSIEAFSRFLNVAAQRNTEQLNFTSVGGDAQVPPRTVREFFSVLEDTLIGYSLPPYRSTTKRKAVATSKFYFFDIGVAHAIQGIRQVVPGTTEHGRALEHLVANELRAYLSYRTYDLPLTYFRSLSQIEVDFVVGDHVAIEVKASGRVSERDAKPLHQAGEDLPLRKKFLVCTEKNERTLESGVQVLPLARFLERLWAGDIVE
ncbi:MAG: AAA family ATPase [Polyangiaceae bacterium]|nr:AAA family ATPase [Polyangiaceae bacterium]